MNRQTNNWSLEPVADKEVANGMSLQKGGLLSLGLF